MPRFPQRPTSHTNSDKAAKTFLSICPDEWVVSPIAQDYGIDFRVEIPTNLELTGLEFYVQLKSRQRVSSRTPRVPVRPQTLNYWLGKLNPTLLVLVDTASGRCWFEWLETAYDKYPNRASEQQPLYLRVGNNAQVTPLERYVRLYVEPYFRDLNEERKSSREIAAVMQLMLHFVAINRYAIETMGALSAISDEQLARLTNMDTPYSEFFLAFGLHDALLLSIWKEDGVFHVPTPRRIRNILSGLMQVYLKQTGEFWFLDHGRPAGDVTYIPVNWRKLHLMLPAVIYTILDIQQFLSEFMVLGISPTLQNGQTSSPPASA